MEVEGEKEGGERDVLARRDWHGVNGPEWRALVDRLINFHKHEYSLRICPKEGRLARFSWHCTSRSEAVSLLEPIIFLD